MITRAAIPKLIVFLRDGVAEALFMIAPISIPLVQRDPQRSNIPLDELLRFPSFVRQFYFVYRSLL